MEKDLDYGVSPLPFTPHVKWRLREQTEQQGCKVKKNLMQTGITISGKRVIVDENLLFEERSMSSTALLKLRLR